MTVADRGQILALVAEAVERGSRQHTACEIVGMTARTLQRWQRPGTAADGRRGPRRHGIRGHRGSARRLSCWQHVRNFAM